MHADLFRVLPRRRHIVALRRYHRRVEMRDGKAALTRPARVMSTIATFAPGVIR
jgi:hypothetical protein